LKVAIIGGTGKIGSALGGRLSKNHGVIIGSRDAAKARRAAAGIEGAVGMDYHGAAKAADVVIFAIPYSAMGSVAELAEDVSGKLVLSLINPLELEGGLLKYSAHGISAAEELAKLLPGARVATAFNNVPVGFFRKDDTPQADVLVAADAKETYEEAAELVRGVGGMRPLYAGPLTQAKIVESITPLVLNLANLNKTGSLTTRFVARKE
jgi:8-hydroxy-5-deazaflavin:NADPH oxidoreductase